MAGTVAAETAHIAHCLGPCPEVREADTEVVVRHLYAAAVDPRSGLAEWVAYRVLPDSIGVASLLPRYWESDGLLRRRPPGELLQDKGSRLVQPDLSNAQDPEYRINELLFNPGDRGRLAPMSSFAGTPYWEELNNLSNMAPLPRDLRLGSWARLETAVNELVAGTGELYVIAGTLPGAGDAYFKIIAGRAGLAAFVFPATLPRHADYCDQDASLELVQNRLSFALFPGSAVPGTDDLLPALGCGG